MKTLSLLVTIVLILFAGTVSAGNFISGSTGADGAFIPTANIEVQLPPDGILNYTTVNIPTGVTVHFKKNAANTPVYILATGDVTISGTIDVSGGSPDSSAPDYSLRRAPGIGGPGGYNGGWGGVVGLSSGAGGKGLGPGGGGGSPYSGYSAGSGGFGANGWTAGSSGGLGGLAYGNARLIPLIGGSGGGGSGGGNPSYGGGGGGGAILIASSGTITISANGYIYAMGGNRYCNANICTGGGSGGAIRLIANSMSGSGTIYATASTGGTGRIRIEAFNMNYQNNTSPLYTYGLPSNVFLANTPSLSITSIGGVNVSSNPTASFSMPDITLPNTTTNPVPVTLAATNIPLKATITVSAVPQLGAATAVTTTLSGTEAASTATASINVSTDFATVIMAYTTYTLQTAMYWEGEKINQVKVASGMGTTSQVTYISESGKEIPATLLAGLMK